jgi:tetratricopeptide (TPR) repeat protein
MAGEVEYAFGHALVRDVAYEQLPRSVRAPRHLAAATWIEAKVGERVGDFADVLAHHYATALELSLAADDMEQAAALEAPAIRFLTLAGERALGLDSTSALASFERALTLTPPGHPARAAVLAGVGEAALEADDQTEAIASLEEAIAAYRDMGDPRAAARAAVLLSEVYVLRRNPRRRGMLAETLALLEPLPPGPEHVAVLTEISGERNLSKEAELGLEFADRALALAADLGLGRPARTLGYRATNRRDLHDPGAGDDFREALDIALAAGQVRHASTIYTNWSSQRAGVEGPRQGLETLDQGIALCRARGLTARVNFMNQQKVSLLFWLGEHDQLLELAEDLVERAGNEPNTRMLTAVRAYEVEVQLLRGRADRVAELPEELEAGFDDEAFPFARGTRIVLSARIRAALGQREVAVALMTKAADENLVANRKLETAVELGEPALAERLASPWNDRIVRLFDDTLIAEARGDLETATNGYPELVDHFRSRSEVVDLVTTLVRQGRVLTQLGRASEAAEALNEARPILVRLEAAPMLAETDALLKQLTAVAS